MSDFGDRDSLKCQVKVYHSNRYYMTLTQKFAYLFSISFGLSILVYLLRGFGIVTFLPGGILLGLLLLAISTFFTYTILITKR
ncbi:hypothetical protein [Chamaesiphon sp. GL140_3_metabinner_50]|uniref:hypothetical protein n=1 Tax=Chamaesiphon sp. GL140_3_metabinner_50 TaxID=2970812 RepID=UPI0025CE1EFF|nr:hypothetical protein [Chamaesiphon sp. GL140_3_metabinner_50]